MVPSAQRPALVVPAGDPRRAAAACRSYAAPIGARAKVRSALLAAAFRAGIGGLAFRDRVYVKSQGSMSLDGLLSDVLDTPVRLAFSVGKVRANRKPVLMAIDSHGAVLGYAKLGVNPLTDALVAHETAALSALAKVDLGCVDVPRVIHSTTWEGHALLVIASLDSHGGRADPAADSLVRAMVDFASSQGVRRMTVGELPWWEGLGNTIEDSPSTVAVESMRRRISAAEALSQDEVAAGVWHGDWNRGNAVMVDDRAKVWDLERFAEGVPLGWDAVHYSVSQLMGPATPDPEGLRRALVAAEELLPTFGVRPTEIDTTITLYLLELATRLVRDGQASLGVAAGEVDRWLLPVIDERLDRAAARSA